MDKRTFYTLAMKAELYRNLPWILSAFCITREDPEKWKLAPYPYKIVSTHTGIYYCSPDKTSELLKIDDATPNEPLYVVSEHIKASADDIPLLTEEIDTTYGTLLANWQFIHYPFGKKLPYMKGNMDIGYIEKLIANRLRDTPKESEARDDKFVYVDEYLRLSEAVDFCTGMSQVCVVAATKKTMLPPPGIKEYRESIINEYKDTINEATTVAKVGAKLRAYDDAWLKGDPGENFLMSKKSRQVVRSKLFLMYGAEVGLNEDSVNVDFIDKSLSEGWDVERFPSMMNALRAGSFNRGAQTELGGVSVKWLLRASANINVTIDDCKTKLGKISEIDINNKKHLVGMNIFTDNGIKLIEDDDEAGTYIGKTLMIRSPAYCRGEKTDFCKACVGVKLASNPYGVSMAISECGSMFLGIFMAMAHGKALILEEMDYLKTII